MRRSLLFGLLSILSVRESAAQCLTNGTFNGACMSNPSYTTDFHCITWADTCGAGWVRSHGSPNLEPNPGMDKPDHLNPYWVYMWASGTGSSATGEGMYTPFTFTAGSSYDIHLYFSAEGDGSVLIYAANGLIQGSIDHCAASPPSISSKQSIKSITVTGGTPTETGVFTFTANANYSQLWIYPVSAGSAKFDILVTQVALCPSCRNTVIYNTGTLPASVTAGTIYAGSSAGTGGSGTVTVQPAQSTKIEATNTISLQQSFSAVVTGTGTFTADLTTCGTIPNSLTSSSAPTHADSVAAFSATILHTITNNDVAPITRQIDGVTPEGTDSATRESSGYTIYPTVGPGTLYIAGASRNMENADITVSDGSGRVVFRKHNTSDTRLTLDLGRLQKGLYFLRIAQQTQSTIQKIIIAR